MVSVVCVCGCVCGVCVCVYVRASVCVHTDKSWEWLLCNCLGKHCFACAWWTVQQHTVLRRSKQFATTVEWGVFQWENNTLIPASMIAIIIIIIIENAITWYQTSLLIIIKIITVMRTMFWIHCVEEHETVQRTLTVATLYCLDLQCRQNLRPHHQA